LLRRNNLKKGKGDHTMPLLKTVPPEEAEGKLLELYDMAEQFFGTVPNNVKMFGVSPAMLENQVQFAVYSMNHPTLSAPFFAMIRLLVSHAAGSPYCAHMNAGLLMQQGFTSEQIEAAKAEAGQVLFVLKATKAPKSTEAKDVDDLRAMGWTDRDIFDAVAHGARAVATNIIFDAFKLEND
jgi:alkylhydroperoxidase family enzyme